MKTARRILNELKMQVVFTINLWINTNKYMQTIALSTSTGFSFYTNCMPRLIVHYKVFLVDLIIKSTIKPRHEQHPTA